MSDLWHPDKVCLGTMCFWSFFSMVFGIFDWTVLCVCVPWAVSQGGDYNCPKRLLQLTGVPHYEVAPYKVRMCDLPQGLSIPT